MRRNRWNSMLSSIADAGWDYVAHRFSGKRNDLENLCRDMLSIRGEASGIAMARQAVAIYRTLDNEARVAFFDQLAERFQCKTAEVDDAIDIYRRDPSAASIAKLAQAAESPRLRLFRRINMAPDGIRAILEMREFILANLDGHPTWRNIDNELRDLLEGWFNPGFLSLTRISWYSPAALLQRLRENEKVHLIPHLEDLRRRLADDRRCYAFFHPALPDEPLIFVQVALVKKIAEKVNPLLDEHSPVMSVADADTAIFYSISACEDGLRGVSLGNFLIKQVVAILKEELPHIKTFSTLSPIPGFRRWLSQTAPDHDNTEIAEKAILTIAALGSAEQNWQEDTAIRQHLLELCAQYLVREKRGRMPIDAVARFHLGNGARLERINWLGDISSNGMEQSAGILVNYLYDEDTIERNHEALINSGEVVHSGPVKKLLPALQKPAPQEGEKASAA